jgi:hypothetical protein
MLGVPEPTPKFSDRLKFNCRRVFQFDVPIAQRSLDRSFKRPFLLGVAAINPSVGSRRTLLKNKLVEIPPGGNGFLGKSGHKLILSCGDRASILSAYATVNCRLCSVPKSQRAKRFLTAPFAPKS